jgi:hypothetical protein
MLTQLEAVNQLLGTIRESPVNSLEDPLPPEALTAKEILDEVSREVLNMGWAFNIERKVTLIPDNDGRVTLGGDVLSIEVDPDTVSTDKHDPVARGPTLFNRATNTYIFEAPVKLRRLYRMLPWDNFPGSARQYITERAARIFANRTSGSQKLERDASIEEQRALRELRREHGETQRSNMLNSPGVSTLAWRNSDWV